MFLFLFLLVTKSQRKKTRGGVGVAPLWSFPTWDDTIQTSQPGIGNAEPPRKLLTRRTRCFAGRMASCPSVCSGAPCQPHAGLAGGPAAVAVALRQVEGCPSPSTRPGVLSVDTVAEERPGATWTLRPTSCSVSLWELAN